MKKSAVILNGSQLANQLLQKICVEIQGLTSEKKASLTLAAVRVGDSKDAILYARYLESLLKKIGVSCLPYTFPSHVTEKKMIAQLADLNQNPKVTGILVFSPLPPTLSAANIFDNIAMLKDVEGRTFLKSHFGVFSPTANAVMALIESTDCDFHGKEAVVIGHSDLVGKPSAILLMDRMATVTVCHAKTRDLAFHVKRADIVVAAAGRANLIKGSWLKSGAIVIDVGENVVNGKLFGDVEFEAAKKKPIYLSPVPGGVGPLTNVMLIKNLLSLYHLQEIRNGNS